MIRRQFNADQKLLIVQEAETLGITAAARKHAVQVGSIREWREKFALGGVAALSVKYAAKPSSEVTALIKENQRLKELLGQKELELTVKSELLKKNELKRMLNSK